MLLGTQVITPDGPRATVTQINETHAIVVLPNVNDDLGPTWKELPVGDLALDLTSATARAHAAWRLAEHARATEPHVSVNYRPDSSPPAMWLGWMARGPHERRGTLAVLVFGWQTIFWEGAGDCWTQAVGQRWPLRGMDCPALAALDRNNPRLLEDGSRWADAEGLRLVCGVLPR